MAALAGAFADASSASSSGTTYSQEQTLAVPPASSFQGSAGGDGWAVTLSDTQVFNVFHHNTQLTVNCRNQSNGSLCWPQDPQVVRDPQGANFWTSGQPDVRYDAATGHLYIYATSTHDSSQGVVCFDTAAAAASQNPFCGYTELTAPAEAYTGYGFSAVGSPMQVGSKWYSFNFYPGQGHVGGKNALLCFDLSTDAACAGQPYTVTFTGLTNFTAPSPTGLAAGSRLFMPFTTTSGNSVACWDASTQANCTGSWPAASPAPAGNFGGPVPRLDSSGGNAGVCLPYGPGYCFDLNGTESTAPSGFNAQFSGSASWNGPGLALGSRSYIPHWSNQVGCWDWSTNAACSGFPKSFNNLNLLYTVNADPQRPTCLWVNADSGGAQIQNFDAYTGGACGAGSTRVLTSQFVVPQTKCFPTAYQSLTLTSPARSSYTSGTVAFADGGGNPIAGLSPVAFDDNGVADLTGLNLDTGNGLPQFVITLTGATATQLSVKLAWTAPYDPDCVGSGTEVTKTATTLAASLSDGTSSGSAIRVDPGAAATGLASLSGDHASLATGSVRYVWYSDSACSTVAADSGDLAIATPGSLPSSSETLAVGTYYLVASYSGDAGNEASQNACGDTVLTVRNPDTTPPVTTSDAPSGWQNHDVTVTLTATDDLSGVATTDYTVDGGPTQTGTSFTLAEGVHTITFWSVDAAGNVEAANTATVQIDETAPSLAPSVAPSSILLLGTGTVSANASDSGSGLASVSCGSVNTGSTGSKTVTCTATDNAGNSASASASYTVFSGKSLKRDALDQVNALSAGASKDDAAKLRDVAKQLTDALQSKNWVDGIHPAAKDGEHVFDDEKDAVHKLNDLLKDKKSPLTAAQLQPIIDELVQADEIFATTAIADAAAAGANAKQLADARRELAKAASDQARNDSDEGIEHLKNAWKMALDAAKHA